MTVTWGRKSPIQRFGLIESSRQLLPGVVSHRSGHRHYESNDRAKREREEREESKARTLSYEEVVGTTGLCRILHEKRENYDRL